MKPVNPLREGKTKSGSKEPSGNPRPTNPPPSEGNPQRVSLDGLNQSMSKNFKRSYGPKDEPSPEAMAAAREHWFGEAEKTSMKDHPDVLNVAHIIDKHFAEKLQDLRLQIDSSRRSLGLELCEGLRVRGYWAPHDTASSDVINAVFQALEAEKNKLKKVCDDHIKVAAKYEKLGNTRAAMEIRKTANLLGAMYQGHEVTTTYEDPDG